MAIEPTGTAPAAGPTPRPSGRARRAASGAPRGIVALAGLTVVSLLVAAVGPLPSHGAHVTPAPVALSGVMDAPTTRGCRPAPPPTPTPAPTAPPTPSPTPDPSASPSPSPTPSPPPTPKPTPTPYIPPGIDVSVWNGSLDYAPIVAKGMRFVFIKATQGTTLVDSRFAANVTRAKAAGLLAGAYHFFDYTADGVAQADHFVDTAAAQGMLSDAMPLTIDVECWNAFGWAIWDETVPRLRAMVDRVVERTGREPILYTSRHMWTQVVGGDRSFGDLPLWVACWRCDAPLLPLGWSRWRFWQIRPYKFKELGKTLDGNVFNGTDESLETWRGSSLLVNDGAQMTAERLVTVDVSPFGGAHLRTADDGSDWSDWVPWVSTVDHLLSAGDGEREVRVQVRSEEGVEGPVLNDRILLDQTGPQLGPPVLTLTGGVIGREGAIPVQVTWTAQDAIAGVASTTLVHDCGPGLGGEPLAAARTKATTGVGATDRPTVRRRVAVAGDDAPIVTGTVPDGTCRLSVRGLDTLGNRTEATSPTVASATITDQSELSLNSGSAWISRSQVASIGGSVLRTKSARATLRFGVQGDQVAIVATKGPLHGRMRVMLDGVTVADVDLYDAVKGPRSVVAVVPLPDDAPHRLRLTVLRTTNPLSKGRRVDLDAIVVAGETAPDPPPAS